ncbi:hypothetical protein U971_02408 [Staphylococcus aureus 56824-15]|nr:hypothetical protein U971_02408 [Staphylococcus aureus 56824-15]EZW58851.1 hypothetical protein U972_02477 [Staphylococcus aureus 56824-21]
MYVVNPDLPEPYKYETDYRKIPKELLNSNIPKGRDKVKWAPFVICTNLIKKSNLIGFKHNIYVNYV